MPTPTGAETIGERLKRLRAQLARVRDTISRAEGNGQNWNVPGAQVTEIAYERALGRERELVELIAGLERRLSGARAQPGVAVIQTRVC